MEWIPHIADEVAQLESLVLNQGHIVPSLYQYFECLTRYHGIVSFHRTLLIADMVKWLLAYTVS